MPGVLNFPTATIGPRLIVLVNERGPLALGVEQVGSIINLDLAGFKPVPNYSQRRYISEIVNWKGTMIGLLEMDQVQAELERLCSNTGSEM